MLCGALNHVHKNGIVHRDIKPENILVDYKTNTLKVIDFGLSKNLDQVDTQGKVIIGTPSYMAPEIFESGGTPESYDAPCDMWGVGVICYQLLTGEVPFGGRDEEGLRD